MSKHFRVSNRIIAKMRESGVKTADVLRCAGLPQGLFDQQRVLVTTEELFALWRGIGEVSQDPAIGLQLGTESQVDRFDPIRLAALSAKDFGEAIRQTGRYKELTCPEEIVTETSSGEWSIQFRWLLAQEAEPELLVDVCFAWVLSLARHGTGERISPLRLEVQRRSTAKILEHHFECPVEYGCEPECDGVSCGAMRKRPFVTQNAELLAMLAPQLDEELKQHHGDRRAFRSRCGRRSRRSWRGRDRRCARWRESCASALGHRSGGYKRAAWSFQQVLEEARHELARHYLTSSPLELNESAYLLGYEDSSSFVRAFRGWEGVPPAHWQRYAAGEGCAVGSARASLPCPRLLGFRAGVGSDGGVCIDAGDGELTERGFDGNAGACPWWDP